MTNKTTSAKPIKEKRWYHSLLHKIRKCIHGLECQSNSMFDFHPARIQNSRCSNKAAIISQKHRFTFTTKKHHASVRTYFSRSSISTWLLSVGRKSLLARSQTLLYTQYKYETKSLTLVGSLPSAQQYDNNADDDGADDDGNNRSDYDDHCVFVQLLPPRHVSWK